MDTQQFEVIRPKCAGLDVHKKPVVAAVCTSDSIDADDLPDYPILCRG